LGSNAQSAVPDLIRIADQGISTDSRAWTIESLGFIGEPARETLPQFLKWATNAETQVRVEAVWALGWAFGKKGFERDRVLPVLIGALQDTNTLVRVRALGSLQAYGPSAKSAVPSLIELLNSDSRPMRRQTVIDTVKAIDPEAAANIKP
jgi:HEAT repeat protein